MGYNLWLSEDSIYTLGRRVRRLETQTTVQEPELDRSRSEPVLDYDMTKINALMDELATRLVQRRLETC